MKENLKLPKKYRGLVWLHRNRGSLHPKHRHVELEFNLVTRGTGRYLLGDRRYDLQRESLVWLFPGQEHVLLDMSADFEMWIAVFKPELVRETCRSEGSAILRRNSPAGEFCKRLEPEGAKRVAGVCRDISETRDAELYNVGLGYLLLSAWKAHLSAPESAGRALHPAVEQAARLLVYENETGKLEALAEKVGLSASRLSRLFKKQTGVSLVNFRQKQQLDRFLRLYQREGKMTMMAAALSAGFGSYPQFHRVFKERMGRGPGEFYRA